VLLLPLVRERYLGKKPTPSANIKHPHPPFETTNGPQENELHINRKKKGQTEHFPKEN
jgi:hypothetical protein